MNADSNQIENRAPWVNAVLAGVSLNFFQDQKQIAKVFIFTAIQAGWSHMRSIKQATRCAEVAGGLNLLFKAIYAPFGNPWAFYPRRQASVHIQKKIDSWEDGIAGHEDADDFALPSGRQSQLPAN